MASGSGSRGRGSAGARGSSSRSRARAAAGAPSAADAALLARPQLNSAFVAMPAADLVAHLNHNRRSDDFVGAALVFADRERRLAESEGVVRECSERIDILLDEIREREYSALEAEAQIRQAKETEAALRAKIADVTLVLADRERRLIQAEDRIREADLNATDLRDTIHELEERVANAEALARDRTVAGEVDDESQAGDHLTANDFGADELTVNDFGAAELTGGEIRARDLEIVVPELGAAAGEVIAPDLCADAGAEVADNIPSPIPLMRIDPLPVPVTAAPALPDELIEERPVEGVVTNVAVPRSHDKVSEAIAVKRNQKPSSDLSLPLHDLRSGAGGSSQAHAAEAPLALLAPQLNPILDAMQAAELIGHLNCYRRTADFIDAAFVLASRERRATEMEAALRVKIRRADETEKALRGKIRTLQLSTATLISGLRGTGLSQQAAGYGREPVPQDFITGFW